MSRKSPEKSDKDYDEAKSAELLSKLEGISNDHSEIRKTLKGLDERLNVVADKLKNHEELCHKIEAKLTEAKEENICQINTKNLRTSGRRTFERKFLYQFYEQAEQIY